jgi:hypothetical protein
MCRIDLVYTAAELKALDRKSRETLTKHGIRLVRTSPQIRNIIKKDPKVRRKLKALLRPKYRQLKRK